MKGPPTTPVVSISHRLLTMSPVEQWASNFKKHELRCSVVKQAFKVVGVEVVVVAPPGTDVVVGTVVVVTPPLGIVVVVPGIVVVTPPLGIVVVGVDAILLVGVSPRLTTTPTPAAPAAPAATATTVVAPIPPPAAIPAMPAAWKPGGSADAPASRAPMTMPGFPPA